MEEKILVVDDEPLILNTIRRALEKKGYQIRTANNAASFLDELEREHADLLIMDINLHGINSETLVGKVRSISPLSKILFISGVLPSVESSYFLEKPFRIDDLREKVREILDRT